MAVNEEHRERFLETLTFARTLCIKAETYEKVNELNDLIHRMEKTNNAFEVLKILIDGEKLINESRKQYEEMNKDEE